MDGTGSSWMGRARLIGIVAKLALATGVLALTLTVGSGTAVASSGVTFDGSPGTGSAPATLGSYQMTAFGTDSHPTGQTVTGVTDPAGAITFDGTLDHVTIGAGWATWSNGYTGDVYATYTSQTPDSVTITMPSGTNAFYLYAEPNPFSVIDVSATTDDGTTSGQVPVNGDGGARFFGFYTHGSTSIKTITVSSSTDFAIGEFGINTSGACSQPNPPQNVANYQIIGGGSYGGEVDTKWDAPIPSCDPVDHYKVVNIHSDGSAGGTADTVPDTGVASYDDTISHLNLCTFYRFGVVAVDAEGRESSIAYPTNPAFTDGFPKASPPVVTIVLQGLGSELPGSSWNPLREIYCTSQFGNNSGIQQNTTLGNLAYSWLNVKDAGNADYAGPGAGNNLIDSAASTGGLVLPLSYVKGTALTGTATSPNFTVPSYGTTDVANANPNKVAGYLNTLISGINRVFPKAEIVVVGHSNGGLIAQQWWANHTSFSPGPQHNVAQVFSLDSPINGIYAGTICIHPNVSELLLCHILDLSGAGNDLLAYYGSLWNEQSTNDPYWASQDGANQMWTPFVTFNDPVYDNGDGGALMTSASITNIGFASQGLVSPNCVSLNWQSGCHLVIPDAVDGFTYNDGSSGLFGAPGDLWVHSVVKNNAQVIAAVMNFIS